MKALPVQGEVHRSEGEDTAAKWAVKRFQSLVADLVDCDGVTVSRKAGFARGGLLINGKLFATLNRDGLLLKLPAARVSILIGSGDGLAFDAGKGRPLKEWVIAHFDAKTDWSSLASEALSFVRDSSRVR